MKFKLFALFVFLNLYNMGLAQYILVDDVTQKKIEYKLSNYSKVTDFDSLLLKYPSCDYLTGMKVYYLLRDRNNLATASKFLDHQLSTYPYLTNGTFSIFAQGLVFNSEKDYNNAVSSLEESLKLDVHKVNKWVRLYLSNTYKDSSKESKARTYIDEALSIDPEFSQAQLKKSTFLLIDGDTNKALEILDDIIQRNGYTRAYSYKSSILLAQGKAKEAKECLIKAIETEPTAAAYLKLGDMENESGDIGEAKKYYLLSIETHKTYLPFQRLGVIYKNENNVDSAEIYLKEALAIGKNIENYNELIHLELMKTDSKAAENLIDEAETMYGPNPKLAFFSIISIYIGKYTQEEKQKKIQEKVNDFYAKYPNDTAWLKEQCGYWKIPIN